MPGRERAFAPLDFKAVSEEGAFEGYASLFDKADLGGDVVAPGAFANSLKRRGAGGIRLLFQHDPGQPVGVWRDIREDAKGLRVAGQLLLDIERAREIHALMKEGALDGLSIGFRTVRGERDRRSGLRRLTEIDLWEISIVTFPLLPGARIGRVKGGLPTEREFERWLVRDAGFSRSSARAVIRSGFKQLAGRQDAAGEENARLLNAMRRAVTMMKSK
jgi:HK97 family phage prohead protease